MSKQTPTIRPVIALIYGISMSLTAFWIINILKESFAGVKKALNWYDPIGPLLGLYITCITIVLGAMFIFYERLPRPITVSLERRAFTVFFISIIVFFFLTFPPIYEIFVHWLKPV